MVDKLLFRPGERLDRYRIRRLLGRGAVAETYLAVQDGVGGGEVALQCLNPARAGRSALSEASFSVELERMRAIKAPNVPRVHDGGVSSGVYWLATEYVKGKLQKVGPPLAYVEALAVALAVTEALGVAYKQRGVIHGDLRPESILIGDDSTAVLGVGCAALFGLDVEAARRTPLYRAPEQLTGRSPVDVRSDIYSLGLLLYALLAGRPPFVDAWGASPSGDALLALAKRGDASLLVPLTVLRGPSAKLAWEIVEHTVRVDPKDRFPSWSALMPEIGGAALACLDESPSERLLAQEVLLEQSRREGTMEQAQYILAQQREGAEEAPPSGFRSAKPAPKAEATSAPTATTAPETFEEQPAQAATKAPEAELPAQAATEAQEVTKEAAQAATKAPEVTEEAAREQEASDLPQVPAGPLVEHTPKAAAVAAEVTRAVQGAPGGDDHGDRGAPVRGERARRGRRFIRWVCAVPALAGVLAGATLVGVAHRRLSVATAQPALPSQVVVVFPVVAPVGEVPPAPLRERRPVTKGPPAPRKQATALELEATPEAASEATPQWAGSCDSWAICEREKR